MGTVTVNGHEVDFIEAVIMMNTKLRIRLHNKIEPCSEQDFIDLYIVKHREVFKEDFIVN